MLVLMLILFDHSKCACCVSRAAAEPAVLAASTPPDTRWTACWLAADARVGDAQLSKWPTPSSMHRATTPARAQLAAPIRRRTGRRPSFISGRRQGGVIGQSWPARQQSPRRYERQTQVLAGWLLLLED